MFRNLLCLIIAFSGFEANASIPDFYHEVASRNQVPVTVVYALAVTETNTLMNDGTAIPWPFTINLYGKAEYFINRKDMVDRAKQLKREGHLKFDLGLFQVNWYWNGRHYTSSVDELSFPHRNGDVAMSILKKYKTSSNTWADAAGLYHNPNNNNGLAVAYAQKFNEHWHRISQLR